MEMRNRMKRLTRLSAAVGLVVMALSWTTQLHAVFIDGNGHYIVEGRYFGNATFNDKGGKRLDYLRHRLWTTFDFKLTDNLSLYTTLSAFNTEDSDFLGTNGQRTTYGNGAQTNPFNNERLAVMPGFKQLWVRYITDFGVFTVGRAPKKFGLGLFYNAGESVSDRYHDSLDRISYASVLNVFSFEVGYQKQQESGQCFDCTVGGSTVGADDMYGIYGDVQYNPDNRDFHFYWGNLYRNNDRSVFNFFLFSLNMTFNKLRFQSEVDYISGTTNDASVKQMLYGQEGRVNDRVEVGALNALIKLKYAFTTVHSMIVDIGYASGDDDMFRAGGNRDRKVQTLGFHRNVHPALLLFNSPKAIRDSKWSPLYRENIVNVSFLKGAYEFQDAKIGIVTVALIWGMLNKVNPDKEGMGAEKNLGFEVDGQYKGYFNPNSGVQIDGGLFFPGAAWKSKSLTAEVGYLGQASFFVTF